MPQRIKNRTIKNFFDEESEDEEPNETFLSNRSDVGFISSTRQPLASSSRQSLRNTNQDLFKKMADKRRTISPEKHVITTLNSNLSHNKENPSIQKDERAYLPRRKTEKKNDDTEKTSKRKTRKPRKMVLHDIRKYQNSTDHLIPKLPFSKIIREILMDPNISENGDLRITPTALEALQESAEIYLTIFFEDAYRCTIHRGRITLIVKDMELVRVLRSVDDPGYRAAM